MSRRSIMFLGDVVQVESAGDALDLIERLSQATTGIMSDLAQIGQDIEVTKRRVDYQTGALNWIGARMNFTGQLMPGGPLSGNLATSLVLATGLGGLGGLNPVPPALPPIQPGPGPAASPHRHTSTPPTITLVHATILAGTPPFFTGASPSDRTYRIQFSPAGNIGAGVQLFQVNYGAGNPLGYVTTPNTLVNEFGTNPCGPFVANPNSANLAVATAAGVTAGFTYLFTFVTVPTTEDFD